MKIKRYISLMYHILYNTLSIKLILLLGILLLYDVVTLYLKRFDIVLKHTPQNNLFSLLTRFQNIFIYELIVDEGSIEFVEEYSNYKLRNYLCENCKQEIINLQNCNMCMEKLENLFKHYKGHIQVTQIKGLNAYTRPYVTLSFSFSDFFYKIINPISIIVYIILQQFKKVYVEFGFQPYLVVYFKHLYLIEFGLFILCLGLSISYYTLYFKIMRYIINFKLNSYSSGLMGLDPFVKFPSLYWVCFVVGCIFVIQLKLKPSLFKEIFKTLFFIMVYNLFIRSKRHYTWAIYLPLVHKKIINKNITSYIDVEQNELKNKSVVFIRLTYNLLF